MGSVTPGTSFNRQDQATNFASHCKPEWLQVILILYSRQIPTGHANPVVLRTWECRIPSPAEFPFEKTPRVATKRQRALPPNLATRIRSQSGLVNCGDRNGIVC
ncbi:MAG: hypothetical protein ACFCD0_05000 [Gemmataceae bacterium]